MDKDGVRTPRFSKTKCTENQFIKTNWKGQGYLLPYKHWDLYSNCTDQGVVGVIDRIDNMINVRCVS